MAKPITEDDPRFARRLIAAVYPTRTERALFRVATMIWWCNPCERGPLAWLGGWFFDRATLIQHRRADAGHDMKAVPRRG